MNCAKRSFIGIATLMTKAAGWTEFNQPNAFERAPAEEAALVWDCLVQRAIATLHRGHGSSWRKRSPFVSLVSRTQKTSDDVWQDERLFIEHGLARKEPLASTPAGLSSGTRRTTRSACSVSPGPAQVLRNRQMAGCSKRLDTQRQFVSHFGTTRGSASRNLARFAPKQKEEKSSSPW
jgi:hypothetical protein